MSWANPTSVAKWNANTVNTTSHGLAATTTASYDIFVFVWGSDLTGATLSVSDTGGNTYNLDVSNLTATACVALAHAAQTVNAGTVTVNITGAANTADWGFIVCQAQPDVGQYGALDVAKNGAAGTTVPPTSGATATVAGGPELVFSLAFMEMSGTPVAAAANSYTLLDSDKFQSGINWYLGGIAYRNIASASGTFTGNGVTESGGSITTTSIASCAVEQELAVPVAYPIGVGDTYGAATGMARRAAAYRMRPSGMAIPARGLWLPRQQRRTPWPATVSLR